MANMIINNASSVIFGGLLFGVLGFIFLRTVVKSYSRPSCGGGCSGCGHGACCKR